MALLSKKKNGVLDVTASMQGSLTFQEPVSLRISGRFQGTLETRGNLTIGEQADVKADVTGEEIVVAGRLSGRVIAKKSLTVIKPAVVTGEVQTPVLRVEPGATIDGSIKMSGQIQDHSLTLEEVAEYLELEVRVVEQWAREGKIPASRKGDQWRFERTKVDDWVAAQKSS